MRPARKEPQPTSSKRWCRRSPSVYSKANCAAPMTSYCSKGPTKARYSWSPGRWALTARRYQGGVVLPGEPTSASAAAGQAAPNALIWSSVRRARVKRSASRVALMSIVARRHARPFARLTEKVSQYGDYIH